MIYIGLPTYNGQINYQTVGGLFNVGYAAGKDRFPICLDVIPYDPFIGHARSLMAERFLSIKDATDMVMIDYDVGFSAEDFQALMKIDADVVAGVYPFKKDEEHYPVAPIMPYVKRGRLVECMFAPTGFMRIRRKVFEKLAETVPKFQDTEHGLMHDFFPSGMDGVSFKSEDVRFCHLVREAGFKVYALEGLKLTHTGIKTWDGEWFAEKKGTTYKLKAA